MDYLSFIKRLAENALRNFTYNYNIISEIKNKYEKSFSEEDSVMIINLSATCKIERFGYAKHDDEEMIII